MRRMKFLLFVMFLGGVWRLYEYNEWMSLKGCRIEADNQALEKRFWKILPARSVRFWLFFLRDAERVKEFLERASPVTVSTHMDGFGRFVTTMKWLKPWLRVQWRGRLWCISREGRMWDASDSGESPGGLEVKGPVWHLASLSDDVRPMPSGVFSSPISIDAVAAFLQEYQDYPWFGTVKEIVLDRRAGAELYRLTLERGKQKFELLIQRSKYGGQELGAMLGDILEKLAKEAGNHRIDATYEGKILLRNLPGGPNEGSLK